jgi:hypothetical protein
LLFLLFLILLRIFYWICFKFSECIIYLLICFFKFILSHFRQNRHFMSWSPPEGPLFLGPECSDSPTSGLWRRTLERIESAQLFRDYQGA